MGVGTISQGFFSTGLRLGAWLVTGGGAWPGWGCGRGRGRQPSSALSGFSSTWSAGCEEFRDEEPSLLSD